jgi:hypothetical protein
VQVKLAVVALVISLAALGVAGFALISDSSSTSDRHRCGGGERAYPGVVTCISNDTPRDYHERKCLPYRTEGRLTRWACP